MIGSFPLSTISPPLAADLVVMFTIGFVVTVGSFFWDAVSSFLESESPDEQPNTNSMT